MSLTIKKIREYQAREISAHSVIVCTIHLLCEIERV